MKNLVKLVVILITNFAIAQNTIQKTIGEFSSLKAYDLITITMIQSDENKVVISGKNADAVSVVNKNGKLKIKMNLEEIFDGDDTEVILHYTKVDLIDVNEGAKVFIKEPIKQFEIDFKAQEGGRITATIETTYLNIRAVTGSVIKVNGSSKHQDISLYTGGVYKGEDCKTEDTKVAIRAAGEAYVNASGKVEVKIRAGGDVYIYGKPRLVDESRVFGGRIKLMN